MRRTSTLLAAIAALSLALAPGFADARAGGGGSFGSRGGMTFSAPPATRTAPYSAQPMQRSLTPNTPSPGIAGAPAPYGSGFGRGSGFASGLMGGLIGAGLAGMLLGHGFFGGGMMGFGGFLGFLLQIGLVVLAVSLLVRWFRRRSSPAFAGGPNIFARGGAPQPGPMGGSAGPVGPPPIQITEQDYQVFERLLRTSRRRGAGTILNALVAGDTRDAELLQRAAFDQASRVRATRFPTCACYRVTWRGPGARAIANTPPWRCDSR